MKVRTNSKQVKEAIRSHLIEISQNDDIQIETTEEAVNYIVDKFYNECIKFRNNDNFNLQDLFIYWISGLSLHTYYMTEDIIDYLHSLGLYGKSRDQEQENSANLYHYLIFKEIKEELYNLYYKVFEEVSEDD